ncbi:hypothetical protein PCE1_003746 [Barthelona sp. PCE]
MDKPPTRDQPTPPISATNTVSLTIPNAQCNPLDSDFPDVPYDFTFAIDLASHGFSNIFTQVDDYWKVFSPNKKQIFFKAWYLKPFFLLSTLIRNLIIFPLRLVLCLLVLLLGSVALFLLQLLPPGVYRMEMQRSVTRTIVRMLLAVCSACIRIHGEIPKKFPSTLVYVSNHTSLMDYLLLSRLQMFSVLGQRAKPFSFLGFVQNVLLEGMDCLWFERDSLRDRSSIKDQICAHVKNPCKPPLLLFPEGSCVNNNYTALFRANGAFNMDGVGVFPVALKYNSFFLDPYWPMGKSLVEHFLYIMKRWAIVVDVHLLPQVFRKPHETPIEFAARTKEMISEAAGLKSTEYDGLLKKKTVSDKVIALKKKEVCNELVLNLTTVEHDCVENPTVQSRKGALKALLSVSTPVSNESLKERWNNARSPSIMQ